MVVKRLGIEVDLGGLWEIELLVVDAEVDGCGEGDLLDLDIEGLGR